MVKEARIVGRRTLLAGTVASAGLYRVIGITSAENDLAIAAVRESFPEMTFDEWVHFSDLILLGTVIQSSLELIGPPPTEEFPDAGIPFTVHTLRIDQLLKGSVEENAENTVIITQEGAAGALVEDTEPTQIMKLAGYYLVFARASIDTPGRFWEFPPYDGSTLMRTQEQVERAIERVNAALDTAS